MNGVAQVSVEVVAAKQAMKHERASQTVAKANKAYKHACMRPLKCHTDRLRKLC